MNAIVINILIIFIIIDYLGFRVAMKILRDIQYRLTVLEKLNNIDNSEV